MGDGAATSLGHLPAEGARWTFDESVADVFDDMLRRSIPDYEEMRRLTTWLALRHHARSAPWVYDLGCARGEALAPLVDRLGAYGRFLGIEVSEPMLAASRQRFRNLIDVEVVSVRNLDLRYEPLPAFPASVVLGVLTLVFVPIEYRQRIVQQVHDVLTPGGCFLLVEKILGADARSDALLTEMYYDFKRASGYSQEEIDRKRLALEGVQVPIAAAWNEELLRSAGFGTVDCYWRSGKFAAWIAVR